MSPVKSGEGDPSKRTKNDDIANERGKGDDAPEVTQNPLVPLRRNRWRTSKIPRGGRSERHVSPLRSISF